MPDQPRADGFDPTALALRLSELWDAEYCEWKLSFEPPHYSNEHAWRLDLIWSQEGSSEHHADWTEHTWQFYGEVPEAPLADAVNWCEGLLPFKRCDECGGDGEYGRQGEKVTCEACSGSGLASVAA